MKYLFVVLLVLVLRAQCYSPEPLPTCTTPKVQLSELPISLNEYQSFNLNNLFTGFNLDFNVSASAPDFVYLTGKTQVIKTYQTKQPGLKGYHFEHRGNRWGNTMMTLSEVNHVTKIRWGFVNNNGSETIPQLTEELTVESESTIDCYDAIWARHASIAIVDCTKKVDFGLQNIFIFVNTTSQTVMPNTMENDMFVGFTRITRRRFVTYQKDGYDYLLRTYFADGVDEHHAHNTYMQVFTFNNPLKPLLLKVIDRSFLGQDKLSIMDFKPYNGAIFALDYHSGMIMFDISSSQHILIDYRYRTDSGYLRMAPYAGHLDNSLIVAFANDHAIYEIDFTERLQPRTIAKYNIMQQSYVSSLWVNEQYVIAQVFANVTGSGQMNDQNYTYNASIIFNRGTRTYLNAYDLFQHTQPYVVIDFERDRNLLMIMDTQSVKLYQLNIPIMTLNPTSNSTMNQTYQFYVTGHSVNQATGHSMVCTFNFKFTVVDVNSMALWPTGLQLPDTYYANYPGFLFVPLDRYILGANITYGVHESVQSGKLSDYWILQQNQTLLDWDKEPSLFKYTFLRQQQYENVAETDIFLYTQDAGNNTHFARCRTTPTQSQVKCHQAGFLPHIEDRIANLTANRFHYYNGAYAHLAAFVYEDLPNQIFIYDVDAGAEHQYIKPIILPDSYEGKISSIEFVGQFLIVVLRYTKEILFYSMNQCLDHQEKQCQQIYRIDSIMMDRLGVDYFSPLEVMASDFHPSVLFIQNIDRVIIISVNLEGPHLLAQIRSPATQTPGIYHWKMAISQDHLVIVNPPKTIQQHRLTQLYTKRDAPMNRAYPVYNYVIPDKFDLDFSDAGNLIYITAEDTKLPDSMNSVILVYHAGLPAVSAFYDVFHLYSKYNDLLIDATGNFEDYVSVAMGSMLLMFRQYQVPVLVFEDSTNDFDFNITYTNDPEQQFRYLMRSSVKISNFPEGIVANLTILNNTDILNDMVDYDKRQNQTIKINDTDWFTGSVINYTAQGCDECGQKIRVVNHLEDYRDILADRDMEDYVFTHDGGFIQQFQSMLQMRHNGSIEQYVSMPAVRDGQNCRHISYDWRYDFVISACSHNQEEIYLYLTTLSSFKPFVNGPYFSSASSIASIQNQGQILVLVDVDENPSKMSRQGGVLIYQLNHDVFEGQLFDELEYIDTTDLNVAQGWTYGDRVYIGNAHLMFTNVSNLYRLAITELRYGVFFVDFRWTKGMRSVEIVNIQFMDLKEQLFKVHLPLPSLAFFEGISVVNEFYNDMFQFWEIDIIVTTRNFHIFQINCFFDKAGKLVDHRFIRVFYRYGFYETSNYIKSFDGYFAVVQKVPVLLEEFPWYSKQVLTIYDSKDKFNFGEQRYYEGDIPASYLLGGMPFPPGRVTFDFNFTFDRNGSELKDIGLLVLHSRQAKIRQTRIHDDIWIVLEQGIGSTQDAQFVARNDFSKYSIPLSVIVHGGLPAWAIVLISLGSLALAAGLGYVGYIFLVKRKQAKDQQIKKSLLEQSAADESESSEQQSDDDQQQSDEGEDEEQLDEQPISHPDKVKVSQTTQQPDASINRESTTSAAEQKSEQLQKPEQAQQSQKPSQIQQLEQKKEGDNAQQEQVSEKVESGQQQGQPKQ